MNNAHYFRDMSAPANTGHWRVGLDSPSHGLVVLALDDAGEVYDRVTLRRFGAYIVFERDPIASSLPAALAFLRPLIEMRSRAQAVGLPLEIPPVLVHSSRIQDLFDIGFLPGFTLERSGKAHLLGVDVVWNVDLDRYAATL